MANTDASAIAAANRGAGEVRTPLDEGALAAWMEGNVADFSGPLTIDQFNGGQSNPTYRLSTPSARYVLRRKPPGPVLKGAHDVLREARIQHALAPTGVPVARTLRDPADQTAALQVTGGAPLGEWLAAQDPRAAMAALQAAGVPAGAMLRVSELPEFGYYQARRAFREVTHPHMKHPFNIEIAPVLSENLPDPAERPAPLLGEHSAQILRTDLGLTEAEIARLIEAGVLEQFTMPQENAA